MHVKRKFGKNEMEVNGTEDQVQRAVDSWIKETNNQEPIIQLCAFIRRKAVEAKIEGAKDMPIFELTKTLLGEKCQDKE